MHELGPSATLQLQIAPHRAKFPKLPAARDTSGGIKGLPGAWSMPLMGLHLQSSCTETCCALAPVGLGQLSAAGIPLVHPHTLHLLQVPATPEAYTLALSDFTPLLQGQAAPAVSPAQPPVRLAMTPSGREWTSQSRLPPCSCGLQMDRAWWHASTTPRLSLTFGASSRPPGT